MAFTQGHALVIGAGTLQHHSNNNVPIAGEDAQAVSAVLQDIQRCGYLPGQVSLLQNEAATRQTVLEHLDNLGNRLTEEDTLFLFFVGHGVYGTDGNYYLTTYDVRLKGSQVVAGTGVSELELLERLRRVKAKRIFIAINACHSGQLQPKNFEPGGNGETLSSEPPPQNLTDALLLADTSLAELAIVIVLLFQFIVPTLNAARNTIITYKQERARALDLSAHAEKHAAHQWRPDPQELQLT